MILPEVCINILRLQVAFAVMQRHELSLNPN